MTDGDKIECHLRELLEQRIEALQALMMQRFDSQDEALNVAKISVDQRLEKLNEMRQMMSDQRSAFEPMGRVDQLKDRLEGVIQAVRDLSDRRLSALENERSNWTGRLSAGIAIIGFLLLIASSAISFAIQQWGK